MNKPQEIYRGASNYDTKGGMKIVMKVFRKSPLSRVRKKFTAYIHLIITCTINVF